MTEFEQADFAETVANVWKEYVAKIEAVNANLVAALREENLALKAELEEANKHIDYLNKRSGT